MRVFLCIDQSQSQDRKQLPKSLVAMIRPKVWITDQFRPRLLSDPLRLSLFNSRLAQNKLQPGLADKIVDAAVMALSTFFRANRNF